MKKILSSILLFVLLLAPNVHAAGLVNLKPPTLFVQMKRQEKVDKAARIIERKLNNQMRLAEIRAREK
jgi:hypothetical protein